MRKISQFDGDQTYICRLYGKLRNTDEFNNDNNKVLIQAIVFMFDFSVANLKNNNIKNVFCKEVYRNHVISEAKLA